MKKTLSIFIACLIIGTIYSQTKSSLNPDHANPKFKSKADYSNWQTFDNKYQGHPESLWSEKKTEFGLREHDEMLLKSEETDELAINHKRYQQYYLGVAVEGGEYIIHSSSEKVWGNGRLVNGIEASAIPYFNKEAALQKALDWFDADKYYWEDPFMEALIKDVKNDPDATFFPKGELVLADEQHSQDGSNYQLCWKFDIHAHGEKMRQFVYINAISGDITYAKDGINYCNTEVVANTCYYGEQTTITDSIAPDIFHLVDCTRGGGIETYNMQNTINFENYIHFVDEDNDWECVAPNNGAIDAHWGMEMFYDFFLTKYNRNSFDGNGAKMISLVHLGTNNPGGFFTGYFAGFGDGGGFSPYEPRTRIEHVGHEFAHGITTHTAGLESTYETGALNESFSSILGTAIEFWAVPEHASWMFNTVGPVGYNMADPNGSTTPWGDTLPDTYQGNYWVTGTDDQGGVHTNGVVHDYCYYLLCEGGSGTNDNGDVYSVEGIGMENATDIFYRNLTVYLTPTSNFFDARQGSIQSAVDLFGSCSNEVEQVINAWYAIGVGPDSYTRDLALTALISPANNCDLSATEMVEVEVLYNLSGCGEVISSGSSIGMSYQLDDNDPVGETWILDQDFAEGETLTFTFSEGISLPLIGVEHELTIYIDYAFDDVIKNNLIDAFKVERKFNYDGNSMGFEEDLNTNLNTFYTSAGENAKAVIDTVARNTGDNGFLMTVANRGPGSSPLADDPSLNFEQQKQLISEICFCVDATDWSDVSLYFDMKQTHSMFNKFWWGNDSTEYVSSMRMLINGEQFGEQFHPDTYTDDPFITYHYSLDQLAGTYFEFCFQSKNYQDDLNDNSAFAPYDTDGDNTYLDNIRFVNEVFTEVEEINERDYSIFPNPANDKIFIIADKGIILTEINIFNQVGQKVLHQIPPTNPIDISMLEHGIYILEMVSGESFVREKLIVR